MMKVLFHNKNSLLGFATALVCANQVLVYTPKLGNGYYFFQLIILICLVFGRIRIPSLDGIWLLLVCLISILVNDIPEYYHIWLRYGIFFVAILLVGTVLKSSDFFDYRIHCFNSLIWMCSGITIASFISLVFGFSSYQNFLLTGITTHSMLLALVANISLIHLIYVYFKSPVNKRIDNLKWFGIVLSTLIVCMATGSRSAFSGGVCGLLVFLVVAFQKEKKKLMLIGGIIILLLVATQSLWMRSFEIIIMKNRGQTNSLNIDSRSRMWLSLWETFKSNPITGIGFATIDATQDSMRIGNTSPSGQIEPGSSWLSVLSMTGLLGATAILSILLCTFKRLIVIVKHQRLRGAYLAGCLTFFILHMNAEGYIYSAGSTAFFIFWILLGTIQAEAETIGSQVVHKV